MESGHLIKPLSGKGKSISYMVIPGCIKVTWGDSKFSFPDTMKKDILDQYFIDPNSWYPLGASADKPIKGGLGEFIQNNFRGYTPRHASSIAAIMVEEGLLANRGKKPIVLKKISELPGR